MLKKLLVIPVVALALVSVPRPVKAVIGTIDAVPAATLLVPYFEVDLNNPAGKTTLFSINNASATAVLAHVTLWSDLSVPTFAFNVYLTGYDVQTINVRDLLNGTVPHTASAGQDPSGNISPKGTFSQDINFASCSGQLPPPQAPAEYVAHLHAAHTGGPSSFYGGLCSGVNHGDNIARGYITVDTVNNCTLRAAGQPGYFGAGGTGDVTNQNVLWGDYFYLDPVNNFASGDSVVHIEASATNPETSTAGQYTFYGRYVSWNAADDREPLPTVFSTRFLNGGPFSGGTTLTTWRDPKVAQDPVACPANPSWYPLNQEQVVVFDEQEQPFIVPPPPFFPQPPIPELMPFPAAAGSVQVGASSLPVPYSFGWLYLNMNTTVAPAGSNPPEDPALAQAWVTTTHSAEGRYSVGYAATQLSNPASLGEFQPGPHQLIGF
jgi:hypothetical protein